MALVDAEGKREENPKDTYQRTHAATEKSGDSDSALLSEAADILQEQNPGMDRQEAERTARYIAQQSGKGMAAVPSILREGEDAAKVGGSGAATGGGSDSALLSEAADILQEQNPGMDRQEAERTARYIAQQSGKGMAAVPSILREGEDAAKGVLRTYDDPNAPAGGSPADKQYYRYSEDNVTYDVHKNPQNTTSTQLESATESGGVVTANPVNDETLKKLGLDGYSVQSYEHVEDVKDASGNVVGQQAFVTRDDDHKNGQNVTYIDSNGNEAKFVAKYNQRETVLIDGKRYQVEGVTGLNEDGSLNYSLKPVPNSEGETVSTDSVTFSEKAMNDKHAEVLVVDSKAGQTMGYNTNEALRQVNYETRRDYTSGENFTGENNTTYRGKIDNGDGTTTDVMIQYDNSGNQVVRDSSGKVVYDSTKKTEYASFDSKKLQVAQIQSHEVGDYGTGDNQKFAYKTTSPDGKDIIVDYKTGETLAEKDASGNYIDVNTKKAADFKQTSTRTSIDGRGFVTESKVDSAMVVSKDSSKITSDTRLGASADTVNSLFNAKDNAEAAKIANNLKGVDFVYEGKQVSIQGTDDKGNITIVDNDGNTQTIPAKTFVDKTDGVVVSNKALEANQKIVGDTLYTTSNNVSDKSDVGSFNGSTKFIKDGVVYDYSSYDSTTGMVTLKYKDANGNEQTVEVSKYELGNNPDYSLVTGADTSGNYKQGTTLSAQTGEYKVAGFIADDKGGYSQSYDRPEEFDEFMHGHHLTTKSTLPGIETATKDNPLKDYATKEDAVDKLVKSGQYTREDAERVVEGYANEGRMKFDTTRTEQRKVENKTTAKTETAGSHNAYEQFKSRHQGIKGNCKDFKAKANQLQDEVTSLQTMCSDLQQRMDGWLGKGSKSADESIMTIKGRLDTVMENITQKLQPAIDACNELDEQLQKLEQMDRDINQMLTDRDTLETAMNDAKQAWADAIRELGAATTHLNSFASDSDKYESTDTWDDKNGNGRKDAGETSTTIDTSREKAAYTAAKTRHATAVTDEATKKAEYEAAKLAYETKLEEIEAKLLEQQELQDKIEANIEKIYALETNMKSLGDYVKPDGKYYHYFDSAETLVEHYDDMIYDFTRFDRFPALTSLSDYQVGDLISLDDSYGTLYKVIGINPDGSLIIQAVDKNGNPIGKPITIRDAREIAPTTRNLRGWINPDGSTGGRITDWGSTDPTGGGRPLYKPPTTVTGTNPANTTDPGSPNDTTKGPDDTTKGPDDTTKAPDDTTKPRGPGKPDDPGDPGGPGGPGGPDTPSQPTQPTAPTDPTVSTTSPPITVTDIPSLPIPTLPDPTDPTRSIPTDILPEVPTVEIVPGAGGGPGEYVPHTGIEAGIGGGTAHEVRTGNSGALGALAGVLAGAAGIGMTAMAKDDEEKEKEEEEEKKESDSEDRKEHKEEEKIEQTIPLTSNIE